MASAREALEAVGRLPDVEIDLAGAALQLARIDRPEADWEDVATHLSALARDAVALARGVAADDLLAQATALCGLLVGEHGYRGDSERYDDPANANLIGVVQRRRGLPVALGILWLHCAKAAGWAAHGVDFPGHFLVALQPSGTARHMVLDVFAGGIPVDAAALRVLLRHVAGIGAELRPGMLAPMSARNVLLRLQENIRTRRLRGGDEAGALACTLDMLRIAPDAVDLWRDAAQMHQRLGAVRAAIDCHERFAALTGDAGAAIIAREVAARLRARLN